jgi:hypothetical protein
VQFATCGRGHGMQEPYAAHVTRQGWAGLAPGVLGFATPQRLQQYIADSSAGGNSKAVGLQDVVCNH